MFAGSLYSLGDVESIDLRMEYSISGPQESHVSCTVFIVIKGSCNSSDSKDSSVPYHRLLSCLTPVPTFVTAHTFCTS